MLRGRSPKRRSKPYIVYNEYGVGMIAHPDIPVLVGIPHPNKIEADEVPAIIDAMMSITKLKGEELETLKLEVIKLVFKYWGEVNLPAINIIRS